MDETLGRQIASGVLTFITLVLILLYFTNYPVFTYLIKGIGAVVVIIVIFSVWDFILKRLTE